MFGIFVTTKNSLEDQIEQLNQETRDWTMRAARGECYWTCADCGSGFQDGMPDECAYGDQRCTEIIMRDKAEALRHNNEI
jgi:hypothetical protein